MGNSLTKDEADEWDGLCNRLDITDDFRSTEASFILEYLRGKGQLRELLDFAIGKAAAREVEVTREQAMTLWETWCLTTCKDHGVALTTDLASEAALMIERLAPTTQWATISNAPVGSRPHKEWILSRLVQ